MRYSSDLRKRVLGFIENGGSKTEVARRFQVSRTCIYTWLAAPDPFTYEKPCPRRPHRLDPDALAADVKAFPSATQKERATHFGVSQQCVWYGLKRIGCNRKKTLTYNNTFANYPGAILARV